MQQPLRLIIADDHALFRDGLKSLLKLHTEVEVVAEVDHAADVLTTLETIRCDVLLLDRETMERENNG